MVQSPPAVSFPRTSDRSVASPLTLSSPTYLLCTSFRAASLLFSGLHPRLIRTTRFSETCSGLIYSFPLIPDLALLPTISTGGSHDPEVRTRCQSRFCGKCCSDSLTSSTELLIPLFLSETRSFFQSSLINCQIPSPQRTATASPMKSTMDTLRKVSIVLFIRFSGLLVALGSNG